jgi:nucleotide-binding universal stress UspA family protein
MKWIVGLDLRPSSQGALIFGDWLVKTTAARASGDASTRPSGDALVGIHVLEEDHLRVALRYHHLDELLANAVGLAERVIEQTGTASSLKQFHVIQGLHAEESLEAARVFHHADGHLVGRQAKEDGRGLIRLGRVARRLLRSLPAPVIVVPPDWQVAHLGTGPVIAMCKLTPDSAEAVELALRTAERIGREVLVLHVVPVPEDYGAYYLPPESLEKIRAEHQQTGEAELANWLASYGFTGVRSQVVQGPTVASAIAVAEAEKATMIVTGSRRLSVFERILLTSIGSEMAAASPCPVMVVPPVDPRGT